MGGNKPNGHRFNNQSIKHNLYFYFHLISFIGFCMNLSRLQQTRGKFYNSMKKETVLEHLYKR